MQNENTESNDSKDFSTERRNERIGKIHILNGWNFSIWKYLKWQMQRKSRIESAKSVKFLLSIYFYESKFRATDTLTNTFSIWLKISRSTFITIRFICIAFTTFIAFITFEVVITGTYSIRICTSSIIFWTRWMACTSWNVTIDYLAFLINCRSNCITTPPHSGAESSI